MESANSHYDVKVALSNITAHLLADKGPAIPAVKQKLAVEVLYTLKWENAFERYIHFYTCVVLHYRIRLLDSFLVFFLVFSVSIVTLQNSFLLVYFVYCWLLTVNDICLMDACIYS